MRTESELQSCCKRVSPMRRAMALLPALLAVGACSAASDNSSARGSGGSAATAPAPAGSTGTTGVGSGTGTGGNSRNGVGAGGTPAGGGGSGSSTVDGGAVERCTTAGSTRVCCNTGVQTCGGSLEFPTWGPCLDKASVHIICDSCGTREFGKPCDAGAPDAGRPHDAGTPDSGKPVDSGPPRKCGPGMVCKPGAVRYCDDPVGGEWSMSTCDATGQWGTCVAVTIPAPAAANGCAQNDFAPEICCGPAMICCQDNPNGPWVDFGSGACTAIACP